MSENKKNVFSGFMDKLKKIKHLDIILTVLFIAIVLLIYFSTMSTPTKNETKNTLDNTTISSTDEFDEYVNSLTFSLENLVSSIDGVTTSQVLVYFDESIKTEIAYTTEIKTLTDGTKIEVKSPVLISNNGEQKPIVLQKTMPTPVSVVVVAKGADNTKVKLEILRLIQSLLNISSQKIEIFAGN